MKTITVSVLFLALAVLAPSPARADDAPARSALVVVVENNDSVAAGGTDRFLRALDRFGEPLYAALLERAAKPYWDRVVLLSDEDARFERFADRLRALDREGYTIDLVLDIHGSSHESRLGNRTSAGPDHLHFAGRGVTAAEVAALGAPHPLRLNAVYMVSCWGSRFNDAWLRAGARAANGSEEINYFVLASPLAFVREFGRGADLATAARRAYDAEALALGNSVYDRVLGRNYGAPGVTRIDVAASSRRIHAGPRVFAARRAAVAPPPPRLATLF